MRRVLVTGASRGIGKAVAQQLARDGFVVTAHYRSSEESARECLEQIQEFSPESKLLQFDVADRDATHKALADDLEEHGAYYGVVCNAGITRDGLFPAMGASDWDEVINTNLNSFYNVVQPLVMPMVRLRSGGRILALTSLAGLAGNAGQVNYSASKAGLIGAARSLSQELAKKKITVNCIAPGLIQTDMIEKLPTEEIVKRIPMKRVGRPEEVADLASFLLSDKASYITGQTISINGGLL